MLVSKSGIIRTPKINFYFAGIETYKKTDCVYIYLPITNDTISTLIEHGLSFNVVETLESFGIEENKKPINYIKVIIPNEEIISLSFAS